IVWPDRLRRIPNTRPCRSMHGHTFGIYFWLYLMSTTKKNAVTRIMSDCNKKARPGRLIGSGPCCMLLSLSKIEPVQEVGKIVAAPADKDAGQYASYPGISYIDGWGREQVGSCHKCK